MKPFKLTFEFDEFGKLPIADRLNLTVLSGQTIGKVHKIISQLRRPSSIYKGKSIVVSNFVLECRCTFYINNANGNDELEISID